MSQDKKIFYINKRWYVSIDFRTIVIFAFCLAINCIARFITNYLSAPFWLDTIGTALAAFLLGPLAGGMTGCFSTILISFFLPAALPYIVSNVCVGFIIGMFYPENYKDFFQITCTAAIAAFIAVVISTPINFIFYQGRIQNIWGDALMQMLHNSGSGLTFSSIIGEIFVDFPDKVLSLLIMTALITTHQLAVSDSHKEGGKKS